MIMLFLKCIPERQCGLTTLSLVYLVGSKDIVLYGVDNPATKIYIVNYWAPNKII